MFTGATENGKKSYKTGSGNTVFGKKEHIFDLKSSSKWGLTGLTKMLFLFNFHLIRAEREREHSVETSTSIFKRRWKHGFREKLQVCGHDATEYCGFVQTNTFMIQNLAVTWRGANRQFETLDSYFPLDFTLQEFFVGRGKFLTSRRSWVQWRKV